MRLFGKFVASFSGASNGGAADSEIELEKQFSSDKEEKKVARMLRIEQQLEKAKKQQVEQAQARLPGESKRAYNRRTKAETRQNFSEWWHPY